MTNENLFRAIGMIGEDLIADSEWEIASVRGKTVRSQKDSSMRSKTIRSPKDSTARSSRRLQFRYALPLVACLALVFVIGALWTGKTGSFGNRAASYTLENGETILYHPLKRQPRSRDIAVGGLRDLREDEIRAMFGNLDFSGWALFDKDSKFVGIEGTAGNVKVYVSAPGWHIKDTMTQTDETMASSVHGIQVTGSCFTTKKISQGGCSVTYYAVFQTGSYTVEAEIGGLSEDKDALMKEISELVDALTQIPAERYEAVTYR